MYGNRGVAPPSNALNVSRVSLLDSTPMLCPVSRVCNAEDPHLQQQSQRKPSTSRGRMIPPELRLESPKCLEESSCCMCLSFRSEFWQQRGGRGGGLNNTQSLALHGHTTWTWLTFLALQGMCCGVTLCHRRSCESRGPRQQESTLRLDLPPLRRWLSLSNTAGVLGQRPGHSIPCLERAASQSCPSPSMTPGRFDQKEGGGQRVRSSTHWSLHSASTFFFSLGIALICHRTNRRLHDLDTAEAKQYHGPDQAVHAPPPPPPPRDNGTPQVLAHRGAREPSAAASGAPRVPLRLPPPSRGTLCRCIGNRHSPTTAVWRPSSNLSRCLCPPVKQGAAIGNQRCDAALERCP